MTTEQDLKDAIRNIFKAETLVPVKESSVINTAALDNTVNTAALDTTIPGEDFRHTKVTTKGIDAKDVAENPYLDNLNAWENLVKERAKVNPFYHRDEYIPGGSVATNINMKNREDTLKYSRLADALNNQYFRSPQIGSTLQGGIMGQGVVGQHANFGELYKTPFETEEMRQMQRARELEKLMKERELGRQQASMDRDLEQEKAEYMKRLELSGKYSDEKLRIFRKKLDMTIDYDLMVREEAFQRARLTFEAKLRTLQIPLAQAKTVTDLAIRNKPVADLFAVLAGANAGAPEAQHIIFAKTQAAILDKWIRQGLSDDQAVGALGAAIVRQGAEDLAAKTGISVAEAKGFIENLERYKSGDK